MNEEKLLYIHAAGDEAIKDTKTAANSEQHFSDITEVMEVMKQQRKLLIFLVTVIFVHHG